MFEGVFFFPGPGQFKRNRRGNSPVNEGGTLVGAMVGGRKRTALLEARIRKLEAALRLSVRRGEEGIHGGPVVGGHAAGQDGSCGEGVWSTAFARSKWLVLFLASLSWTAVIMGRFEHV